MTTPPYYHQPPPPAKKTWSSARILTVTITATLAVLLVCGGIAAIGYVTDRQATSQMQAMVTKCTVDGRVATVGYEVRNRGNETHSVRLDFEYRDESGARIDTDFTLVDAVPAGDSVRGEETTHLDTEAHSVDCRIVRIA